MNSIIQKCKTEYFKLVILMDNNDTWLLYFCDTRLLGSHYLKTTQLENIYWISIVWGRPTMLKSRFNNFFSGRLTKGVPHSSQLPQDTYISWLMIPFTRFKATNLSSIWSASHWNSFLYHGLGRLNERRQMIRLVCLQTCFSSFSRSSRLITSTKFPYRTHGR